MRRKSPAPRAFRIAAVLIGFGVSSAAFGVTVAVTSTADTLTICASTGQPSASGGEGCTLRDAITFSNANPPPPSVSNLIQFNIPGSGVHTIALLSNLPGITTSTIIDGYSQPGASPNTLAVGDDAVLRIQLYNGGQANPLLGVVGGAGSLIKGLVLNSQSFITDGTVASAIVLDSPWNVVAGNFIGIAPDGNSWGLTTYGNVIVNSGANVIGGSNPADRNLLGVWGELGISGLVEITGAGNHVQGNYFGTNAAGFLLNDQPPTLSCILVTSDDNLIGGSSSERNVIAGCSIGIFLEGGGAFANLVQGNFIGTDATGGNGALRVGAGIFLYNASLNFLGALTAGNRIAFSRFTGILLQGGSQGNAICCNSIFSNGDLSVTNFALGIDLDLTNPLALILDGDGVTPNDTGDPDGGPNGVQNFPVLTQATSDNFVTNIIGTLNSLPNTSFRIQFFSNTACDPSGYGEGEDFLGESFVATNANGDASFNASPLVGGLAGQFITSMATNLSTGDTSEFSLCQQVEGVGGHKKVKGTIQSIDPPTHSFVLGTAAGGVTVWTDAETRFRKKHQRADFSALAAGDRAKVKGYLLGNGSILALKVTVPQEDPDE